MNSFPKMPLLSAIDLFCIRCLECTPRLEKKPPINSCTRKGLRVVLFFLYKNTMSGNAKPTRPKPSFVHKTKLSGPPAFPQAAEWYRIVRLVAMEDWSIRRSKCFVWPVDPKDAPEYHKVIRRPKCFAQICDDMLNSIYRYFLRMCAEEISHYQCVGIQKCRRSENRCRSHLFKCQDIQCTIPLGAHGCD